MEPLRLENPEEILKSGDREILQEAQDIVNCGLTESEGIALRAALSNIIKIQSKLSSLKGQLLYTLSIKRIRKSNIAHEIFKSYEGNKLARFQLESLVEMDSTYIEENRYTSAIEALIAVVDDTIWNIRSMIKYYQV